MGSSTSVKKSPALSRQTSSEHETLSLAAALGRLLHPGDWISLVGELGVGKTAFVRGLGQGLHCPEPLSSPTFSLIQTHRTGPGGRGAPFHHADLFRLEPRDISTLDWEEMLSGGGVTVVEWADKARPLWPADSLAVHISHRGGDSRLLEFFPGGPRSAALVSKLKEEKSL